MGDNRFEGTLKRRIAGILWQEGSAFALPVDHSALWEDRSFAPSSPHSAAPSTDRRLSTESIAVHTVYCRRSQPTDRLARWRNRRRRWRLQTTSHALADRPRSIPDAAVLPWQQTPQLHNTIPAPCPHPSGQTCTIFVSAENELTCHGKTSTFFSQRRDTTTSHPSLSLACPVPPPQHNSGYARSQFLNDYLFHYKRRVWHFTCTRQLSSWDHLHSSTSASV